MKTILIIDDDKKMHEALVNILNQFAQHQYIHAYNHKQVFEVTTKKIDLIICDVYLEQDVSGIDIIQDIRRSNYDTPIILTSGEIQKLNTKNLSINNLHFISRPYDIDELQVLVKSLLT